jgi:type II restriction enzyme
LAFQHDLASAYRGPTQRIKVLTESWAERQAYCVGCGRHGLARFGNNQPVADLYCPHCREQYELKSQAQPFKDKVQDGAYATMMRRLASDTVPNLMLLHYDRRDLRVRNLSVIPKQFFIPALIEQRPPLADTARRKGWVGCRILVGQVPAGGRIPVVNDGLVLPEDEVKRQWRRTLFLRDQATHAQRGWLMAVMRIVDTFGARAFSLRDVYAREETLTRLFPSNRHIRPKIRQQLQVLRDQGYLLFLGNGRYQLASARADAVIA